LITVLYNIVIYYIIYYNKINLYNNKNKKIIRINNNKINLYNNKINNNNNFY